MNPILSLILYHSKGSDRVRQTRFKRVFGSYLRFMYRLFRAESYHYFWQQEDARHKMKEQYLGIAAEINSTLRSENLDSVVAQSGSSVYKTNVAGTADIDIHIVMTRVYNNQKIERYKQALRQIPCLSCTGREYDRNVGSYINYHYVIEAKIGGFEVDLKLRPFPYLRAQAEQQHIVDQISGIHYAAPLSYIKYLTTGTRFYRIIKHWNHEFYQCFYRTPELGPIFH